MSEILDLGSLDPIEIEVKIDGEIYKIKEASGDAACKYRNAMLACTTLGPDGKPTNIEGMADVEPLLVSLCLYNSAGKRVNVHQIRGWPSRIQKALFEQAKNVSELDADEDTDEDKQEILKNELGGMKDG